MNMNPRDPGNTAKNTSRKIANAVCVGLAPVVVLASTIMAGNPAQVGASSHREAPLISRDAYADNTDTYAFVSPDKPDTVTLIASWIPFEHPAGGPNYFNWADDVGYYIFVDNNGDAEPDFTYKLTTKTTTKNPNTFLYNTGPMTGINTDAQNIQQAWTLEENGAVISTGATPPVNVGVKSTPDYLNKIFKAGIYTASVPGMQVFAGQTDDPFFVDLEVFDLLTLRTQAPPIGFRSKGVDSLAGFNVHSLVLQIPTAHLLKGAPAKETVIGVWSTSTRKTTTVLGGAGGPASSGAEVQVSRLGMPLVNEVVLPLALKDAFNSIPTTTDFDLFGSDSAAGKLLKQSVLKPELATLLNALYGVPLPTNKDGDPADRNDLLAIFLTGMKTTKEFTIQTKNGPVKLPAGFNVNQPQNVRPAEMIRLNTAISGDLCKPKPDYQLGLLGGDACGFPNGRRLADNTTYIELLAVAGAAYPVLTEDTFNFSSAIARALRTGVTANDLPFSSAFPYVAAPHSGTFFRSNGGWK